jgi:DNA-binding CsgD family transcriptional regulator
MPAAALPLSRFSKMHIDTRTFVLYNTNMNWLQKFLQRIGLWPQRTAFYLERDALVSLQTLSERANRPPAEVAAGLFQRAAAEQVETEALLQCWQSLTRREQQVAALICLGYTGPEIAARLVLSPETVKSHAHSILAKFGVPSRSELRQVLAGWDFSSWDFQD